MIAVIWSQLKRTSACLGLAAIVLFAHQAPAIADPALWVLKDADSAIYLFGTVHALKPGVQWHNADIDAAFAASSELWVEETDDTDQAMVSQLINRYGLDPAHSLLEKLPGAQRQKLANAAQAVGVNLLQIDRARPWLAALQLDLAMLVQAGFDPNQGIDRNLRAAAKAAGKPINGFETTERQFHVFADLSPQDELEALAETLRDIDKGPAYLTKLSNDWLSGDMAAIDNDVSVDMRQQSPSLYKAVFLDRNAAWTKRIEQLLAGQGTIFIAVGCGHLAGSDSVIAMLQRDGYQVTRK